MKRFVTLMILLQLGVSLYAQQVVRGEYFFDTDPGTGNGTSISVSGSPTDSATINFSASAAGLTPGFHRIYTRFLNNNGAWGFHENHLFFVIDTAKTIVQQINAPALQQGEYFIDADPGVGKGTMFTFTAADSIQNLAVNASVASLPVGFHKLYVRVKDAGNKWSLHDEHLFYIYDTTKAIPPAPAAKIVAMEYFFDANDYGPGQCAPLNPFAGADSVNIMDMVKAEDPVFLTPLSAGEHTLNIRAKDANGKWGMTQSVAFTVCTQPADAEFTSVVNNTTVTFTNTSTNDFSTRWIFGNGATDTTRNPVYTYNNGGVINACMIAYSGCGNDTVCHDITLNCVSPIADFTSSANNLTVDFTNTSNAGGSFNWTFGDTKTSSLENPVHVFQNTGSYNVCLTTTNGCGSDTKCEQVSVNCVAPQAGFTYDVNGFTVSLINTSTNAYNFIWNFGNSQTNNTDINPVIQYATTGTYTIKLTVQNGCGVNSYQTNVTINCAAPEAGFNFVADGLDMEVENVSVNGSTWAWNFGDNTTSIFKNPAIHSFPSTGTYSVCLKTTNSCGADSVCKQVSVCTGPTAQFTETLNATTASFTNNSTNGDSYLWDFGDGNITNLKSPTHQFTSAGVYNVCLNITNNCGNDQFCKNIAISCVNQPVQEICMVTVDSLSKHNIIIWDKTTTVAGADSFIVHREVTPNVYVRISAVAASELSEYVDTSASGNPNVTTYKYKLQIRDTCGIYGPLSNYHNTIFVSQNNSTFTWNSYVIENSPNPVSNYVLMRDDLGKGNWHQAGTTSGSQNVLNDPDYALYPNGKWRVETIWGITCVPTAKSYFESRSNTAQKLVIGINQLQNNHLFSVYPNPSNGVFEVKIQDNTLLSKEMVVSITDITGRVVKQSVIPSTSTLFKLDLSEESNGVYYMSIQANNVVYHHKIVIQK